MSRERTALIAARTKRHWTLEQAAEMPGVNHNTLWRWEQGKTAPRGHNLQRLCKIHETTEIALGLEDEETLASAQSVRIRVDDEFIASDLTSRLFALTFLPQYNFLALQDSLITTIEEYSSMNLEDHVTRRDALRRLATLPLLTLKLTRGTPVIRASEAEMVITLAILKHTRKDMEPALHF